MKTLKTKAPPGRRGRCRDSELIGAAWALPGFRTDRGGVFGLYNV